MKLLESTKSKIKNENCENVPYLEITEVILIDFDFVSNSYQQIQKSCIHLFLINILVNY